jgi:hypothetical protein
MKCQDFREIVDSYLSDELLTETNHEVLRHLEMCADCRSEIQTRRILREKLQAAVKNAEAFQMRDGFHQELLVNLRQNSQTSVNTKTFFGINRNSWMAVAACLILTFGLGFWFLRQQTANSYSTDVAGINNSTRRNSLENIALGDHLNCAVKFNLPEDPIDIDLASPQYADLRQVVLNPLKNSPDKYEFIESHTCKYQGHDFVHIVFQHLGKMISVLLTDSQNLDKLKNDEMIKTAGSGYQIARFDRNNQAVFVVSDLSEQENFATAKILATSAHQEFSVNRRAESNSLIALYLKH